MPYQDAFLPRRPAPACGPIPAPGPGLGDLHEHVLAGGDDAGAPARIEGLGFDLGWRLAAAEDAPYAGLLLDLVRHECGLAAFLGGLREGVRSLYLRSPEAERHLARHGPSGRPVCWAFCGFAGGYLSRALGRSMAVRELGCAAMGHARCHFQARPREAWLEPPEPEADTLVALSAPMRRVLDLALRVAPAESTLLITGESGTGKERVARLVHAASPRARGPFVAVNCGAIAEALLESELFGHARGAFTGAVQERPGLFEAAAGGTLLLDEVGEVPPAMQVKLLRVLQEREVRRVGENRTRRVDARVLAATNADLAAAVREGRFRRDLFYRLNVVELRVPPLRERREDILPLARHLLAAASARLTRPVLDLAPEVEAHLLRHPWPGNVRELENAMERAAALADPPLLTFLPVEPAPSALAPAAPPGTLAQVEREHILAVLAGNGGNQARTAAQLGIGTATLYRKLKAYGQAHPRRPGPVTPPEPPRRLCG